MTTKPRAVRVTVPFTVQDRAVTDPANLLVWFGPARAWDADGARVSLTTCRACGDAVLLDPDDTTDPRQVHVERHLARGEEPGQ